MRSPHSRDRGKTRTRPAGDPAPDPRGSGAGHGPPVTRPRAGSAPGSRTARGPRTPIRLALMGEARLECQRSGWVGARWGQGSTSGLFGHRGCSGVGGRRPAGGPTRSSKLLAEMSPAAGGRDARGGDWTGTTRQTEHETAQKGRGRCSVIWKFNWKGGAGPDNNGSYIFGLCGKAARAGASPAGEGRSRPQSVTDCSRNATKLRERGLGGGRVGRSLAVGDRLLKTRPGPKLHSHTPNPTVKKTVHTK